MIDTFAAEFLKRQLATMTDEQVLEFIGSKILTTLTAEQKLKLRRFIDQRVPDPESSHAR